MVWPLHIFYCLVYPLRVVLTAIADVMIRIFGGKPEFTEPMIMENEYRNLIDLGRKEGVIIEEERELIHNVFEFTNKVASDIMTREERVFSLPLDLPYDRLMEEIRSTQFSRVPFYDSDRSKIVGILHVRDLLSFHRRKIVANATSIRDILRPAIFVDPGTPLEKLLSEFQKVHVHMAFVRDSGGELIGLVTMDDVLEELFGEIEE